MERLAFRLGPLVYRAGGHWKRVAAVDKLAPCNLSRYLHAARSLDPHSTFSSCRPTNPLGWLISRRGTLFSFVAFCTNLLSLFAPLPQFHPTSFWGFETALAHQEAGCIVIAIAVVPFQPSNLFRPPRLDSLLAFLRTLYLPTTCLGPSSRPTSTSRLSPRLSSSEPVSTNACHKVGLPLGIALPFAFRLQRLQFAWAKSKCVSSHKRHSPRLVPSRSHWASRGLARPATDALEDRWLSSVKMEVMEYSRLLMR